MRAYILASFWLCVIATLARCGVLAWADYPRMTKWTRGEDVLGLLIHVGFLVWAAWLLWA